MTVRNSPLARCSVLLASGALAVALLSGCGEGGSSASPSSSSGSGASTAEDASVKANSRSAPKSSKPLKGSRVARQLVAAGTTALKKVGRGTVTSIDAERGRAIWEVDIVTSDGVEHELHVSRNGTKVLSGPRTKHEDAEDRAENRREARGAKLDYKAAVKKVLAARTGRITELNLDDHRGQIVWEADVHRASTKYEVEIDAASGKVVHNNADRGDVDDD
jgi:uncharacterized membrane protein YkoI